MHYSVQYQYRPKGKLRPNDDGELVPIEIGDSTKIALLPSVGDYVHIGATKETGHATYGVVASKLFNYQQISSGEVFCTINIVIDESDEEVWPTLIKE